MLKVPQIRKSFSLQHTCSGTVSALSLPCLLLSVLFLCSCGSSSEPGVYDINKGHQSTWVNPEYIGTDGFHGSHVRVVDGEPLGTALFLRRCAGCHGDTGSGKAGPDVRGRTAGQIRYCIESVTYMSWLSILSDKDLQAISDYLAGLQPAGSRSSPSTVSADSCSECHGRDLKGGISKISCYSCHKDPDGTVGHPDGWLQNSNPSDYHGRYAKDFAAACTSCHGPDLRGPAVPNCYNCHNGSEWEPF